MVKVIGKESTVRVAVFIGCKKGLEVRQGFFFANLGAMNGSAGRSYVASST